MRLKGAIIAVTGASGDIGRAVCEEFSARGAVVCPSSLSGQAGPSVDVREADMVEEWVRGIVSEHGKLDLFVHCAGTSEDPASILEIDEDEFFEVLESNVLGTFHVLRSALGVMVEQNGGAVLVIASRAARKAHPLLPAYSAAKAATLSLCVSSAKHLEEAKSPVTLSVLSPSGVQGALRSRLFGEEALNGMQMPGELAAVIADIAEGKTEVPHGSDVIIDKGAVAEIIPLRS